MTLPKLIATLFRRETLLLIPAMLFLWYASDALYSYLIDERDLIAHSGKITQITAPQHRKDNSAERAENANSMQIFIDNYPNEVFTLIGAAKSKRFAYLTKQLNVGDNVVIFTEPILGQNFIRSESRDVSKLIKGDKVMVPYPEAMLKRANFNFLTISLLPLIGILALYLIKIRRK